MDNISNKSVNFSKPENLVFLVQVVLVLIVVCVSLLNLTMHWWDINIWTVILTGTMGYIMPNPKLKADSEQKNLEGKRIKQTL